jgi:hypothetical protein
MFPKAASVFPFTDEITLTTSSGAEVPKETTVRPMARLDIPNFFAADEAPPTKKSAPLIKITKPITSRSAAISIREVRVEQVLN